MITAVVQFKLPKGTTREDMLNVFKATAPNYQGMPGLVRKYYLYGDDGVAGGAYLWHLRVIGNSIALGGLVGEWTDNCFECSAFH